MKSLTEVYDKTVRKVGALKPFPMDKVPQIIQPKPKSVMRRQKNQKDN